MNDTRPWWAPEMRELLALLSTLVFAAGMFAPALKVDVAADFRGAIIIQWGAVMSWYFGSSKSSSAKDATINKLINKEQP